MAVVHPDYDQVIDDFLRESSVTPDTNVTLDYSSMRVWIRSAIRWFVDTATLKTGAKPGDKFSCPLCRELTQVYPRVVSANMTWVLISMYRLQREKGSDYWMHVINEVIQSKEQLKSTSHDYTRLRFWGLIEERPSDSDGPRQGYWRMRPKGNDFVEGRVTIPRSAICLNNRVLYWDQRIIDVHAALRQHFDYDELMGRRKD